jgi:hypothetical protein
MPPDPHLKPTAAVALALALLAAPAVAASTKPQSNRPTAAPTIVRVIPPGGGFDWGDASIGAIGGFAVSMIAVGGALIASGHRTRHRPQEELRAAAPRPSTSLKRHR